jgi:hypothetical protein
MNTISDLLHNYSEITKSAEQRPGPKVAFIANPAPPQPQQPQGTEQPTQQPAPPLLSPEVTPEIASPAPSQDPSRQAPQQAAGQPSSGGLMDQVLSLLQQLPPQVQQQVAPVLQQIQSMPPDQRDQQLAQILQELSSPQQAQAAPAQAAPAQAAPAQAAPAQAAQPAPQQGMVAQAADEDLYDQAGMGAIPPELIQQYMQEQQGGEALDQIPQEQTPPEAPAQQDAVEEDAANAEASAVEAKNELDNVKVTLSVRELLDLVGKGTATASLLKVKQLADTHKQKMEQTRQKAEADQQKAQQGQTADQQGMMGSGGIYPTPMGG